MLTKLEKKIKMWHYKKTHFFLQNSKTWILSKLKNSNCKNSKHHVVKKTQKNLIVKKLKNTIFFVKIKNLNINKTLKKIKLWPYQKKSNHNTTEKLNFWKDYNYFGARTTLHLDNWCDALRRALCDLVSQVELYFQFQQSSRSYPITTLPRRYQYAIGLCPRKPSTPCLARYQAWPYDSGRFKFVWELFEFSHSISVTKTKF